MPGEFCSLEALHDKTTGTMINIRLPYPGDTVKIGRKRVELVVGVWVGGVGCFSELRTINLSTGKITEWDVENKADGPLSNIFERDKNVKILVSPLRDHYKEMLGFGCHHSRNVTGKECFECPKKCDHRTIRFPMLKEEYLTGFMDNSIGVSFSYEYVNKISSDGGKNIKDCLGKIQFMTTSILREFDEYRCYDILSGRFDKRFIELHKQEDLMNV